MNAMDMLDLDRADLRPAGTAGKVDG